MKYFFIILTLIIANCVSKQPKQSFTPRDEFEQIAKRTYDRAMEPYVMGGEDDTRLWIDVKTHCFKLGDEELSHKLQSLTLQMRGAFRFFLSRHSLERRGYSKCIQVLADQRIPIYPAARAAEKAFGESAEEYLSKENGW